MSSCNTLPTLPLGIDFKLDVWKLSPSFYNIEQRGQNIFIRAWCSSSSHDILKNTLLMMSYKTEMRDSA